MSPSSTPHLSSTASYPTPSTVVTSSGLVQTTQPIRLPPLIPKAITDKLVYQQSQMEEMQRQMQRQDDTIESLRNTVDDLSNSRDDFLFEMKDLDAENIHLLQCVDVLENLVRKQTKKIDQLFEMLEDSEPHERTKRDEDSKPKATRDNVLNVSLNYLRSSHSQLETERSQKNTVRCHGTTQDVKGERCSGDSFK
jgi:chromosome segregation ATPase